MKSKSDFTQKAPCQKIPFVIKEKPGQLRSSFGLLLVKEEPSDHCIVDVSVNKAIIKQRQGCVYEGWWWVRNQQRH